MADPIRRINQSLAPEEKLIGAAAGLLFLYEFLRPKAPSLPPAIPPGTGVASGSSGSGGQAQAVSLTFGSLASTIQVSSTQRTRLTLTTALSGPAGTYTVALPISGPLSGLKWYTTYGLASGASGVPQVQVALSGQPVTITWSTTWQGNAGTWTTKGLVTVAGQTTTFQGPTFTVTVAPAQLTSGSVSARYNSVSVVQGHHLPDLTMTIRNPFAQTMTFTIDMQSTGGPTITWVVDTRKSLASGVSAVSGPNAPSQPNSRAKVTLAAGASVPIPWTALMQAAPGSYQYTATKIVVGY